MDSSIYRLRPQDVLCFCVLALLMLGCLMVQSAAMNINGVDHWHWNDRGTRHLVYVLCAIFTFFLLGQIDYRKLVRPESGIKRNPVTWALATAGLTCVLVLIPHVGMEVNGARRWLPMGFAQVQPSELAKWSIVVFLAYWLTFRPVDLSKFFSGFLLTLVPIGAICLLVVIQDFGTAALIGVCSIAMLLAGKVKWWHLLIVLPPILLAAFWFVHHKDYRWQRMIAFTDPYSHLGKGEGGYHIIQSLLSFATGGFTGRGLGNGVQKLGYLPEDTTDFIFAVICEELGFFGALLTIVLYLGILWVGWQVVKQKRDSFGRMLAYGIASMLTLQAVINIAVATVSVPTKGLSLPLVSAGGSGLVITCTALGILYSVTRFEHKEAEEHPAAEPISLAPAPSAMAA